MKKITLLWITCILLFLAEGRVRSQTIMDGSQLSIDTTIIDTASIQLKSFTGKYVEGSIYLKWIIANEREDGVFTIYSSVDGKKFEIIGYKEGVGVPVSNDIAYYFTDETPRSKRCYYKLVFTSDNKIILTSDEIYSTVDNRNLADLKNNQ